MKEMNIPVGVSDFEEIRKNGYYYIDKSGLIGELISRTGTKVTLITRPRRFGKTLGMSMLESFFDIRKDSRKLFEGLEITKNQALCDEWMNQYPTIFVSFRQVDGLNFTGAYDMLTMVIADLYNKHLYLLDSKSATEFQKTAFAHLAHGSGSIKEVKSSLMLLTTMMQSYYEKPVILLIDEYDVPVAKANNNGYYDEMLDVMKGLMQALKDNQALRFAVVTGCLNPAECAGNPAQTEKLIKEQRDTINYKERWNADSKCGHGCTRKSCNFVTNVSRTVDGDWSWRGFGYRNHVQKLAFFKPFFLFNELIFKQRNHSVSAAKGERTDF